ncbi:unnamed protein product [Pleuronectes platessa]|uniref:Uncharacterized protein n=1 Tax=Pleuronectes platessa TaxID=8262 RepID=A0A9N7Z105_PLEPL|nr:unnamed protein product [Pleuronectes platessa]
MDSPYDIKPASLRVHPLAEVTEEEEDRATLTETNVGVCRRDCVLLKSVKVHRTVLSLLTLTGRELSKVATQMFDCASLFERRMADFWRQVPVAAAADENPEEWRLGVTGKRQPPRYQHLQERLRSLRVERRCVTNRVSIDHASAPALTLVCCIHSELGSRCRKKTRVAASSKMS